MDLKTPDIDPRVLEISRQITERKRKEARRSWWKEHSFEAIGLLIALLSLIATIIFGVKSCSQREPQVIAAQTDIGENTDFHEQPEAPKVVTD